MLLRRRITRRTTTGLIVGAMLLFLACSNRLATTTTTLAFSTSTTTKTKTSTHPRSSSSSSTTQLHIASNYAPWTKASFKQQQQRPSIQLNFNDHGESPFGFDLTAEIWNGRFAQIGVVWVACQELIQGRGILQSFADNQQFNVIALLGFLGLISAMTLHLLYDWYFPYPPSPSLPTTTTNIQPKANSNSDDDDNTWGYAAAKAYTRPKQVWNLNNVGESPYGFGRNAEMWNGRIAMLSFVWILAQETIEKRGVIPGIMKGFPSDFGSFAAFCLGLFSFMGFLDYASKEEEERLLTSMKAKKKEILARKILDFSTPPQEARPTAAETPSTEPAWNTAAQPPVSYAPVRNTYSSSEQQATTAQPVAATSISSQNAALQQQQRKYAAPAQSAAPPVNSYGSAAPPPQQKQPATAASPTFSYRPATQPQQPAAVAVSSSSVQQQSSYLAPLPAAAAAILRSPYPSPEPFRFKSEVQGIATADSANRPPRTKEYDPTPIRTNPPPPRPTSRAEAVATTTMETNKRSYAISQAAPASQGRTPGGSYLESLSPY